MTLRTITFDDSTHKLVPIIADESMLQKGEYYCESALLVWRDMTAAAPEYQEPKPKTVQEKFKEGDFVFGLGKEKGCSRVFFGYGKMQPFDYLNNFNPDDFRLATNDEIFDAGFNSAPEGGK